MIESSLEIITAILLILSGLATLVGAFGVFFLPNFFDRAHAPALAYSAGAWLAGLAAITHFARIDGYSGLKAIFVAILLAMAVPVSNMMLARAGLFRRRWQIRRGETDQTLGDDPDVLGEMYNLQGLPRILIARSVKRPRGDDQDGA